MNNIIERPQSRDEGSLSRVEQVYRKIKAGILNNEYPADYQILEPELATQLGVSRTPVREALIRLAADNLVLLIPRRGMKVLPIAAVDVKGILQVLRNLEQGAVELLCDAELNVDFQLMRVCVQGMSDSLLEKDFKQWFEHDELFCEQLTECSGNQRLHLIAQSLRDQIHRPKLLTLELRSNLSTYTEECKALLALIESRDKVSAREAYRKHAELYEASFIEIMDKYKLEAL
jgi:DNA-binding GntR family transcriptional regulator